MPGMRGGDDPGYGSAEKSAANCNRGAEKGWVRGEADPDVPGRAGDDGDDDQQGER